jgi:uncharacterized membrane protein YoaK (UPF0700 family)
MTNPPHDEQVGIWPRFVRDPAHGPLPVLLLVLTTMTGLVDAVSILGLGRVFVANMTGNVVFIGFALAAAPGFSLSASVAALVGFLVGAFFGGLLVSRFATHRGVLLRNTCAVQFVLIGVAFLVVLPSADLPGDGVRVVVAALCAAAMGMQNTAARRLAVPDLTTTVLTMTLTGIVADIRHSPSLTTVNRALAVLTMALGAVAGALLILHTRLASALGLALVLLGIVVVAATSASRRSARWQSSAVRA